jgi:hypothetical protein
MANNTRHLPELQRFAGVRVDAEKQVLQHNFATLREAKRATRGASLHLFR